MIPHGNRPEQEFMEAAGIEPASGSSPNVLICRGIEALGLCWSLDGRISCLLAGCLKKTESVSARKQ